MLYRSSILGSLLKPIDRRQFGAIVDRCKGDAYDNAVADPLDFDQRSMRALFAYGLRCAANEQIWLDLNAAVARAQRTVSPASSPEATPCPTQD